MKLSYTKTGFLLTLVLILSIPMDTAWAQTSGGASITGGSAVGPDDGRPWFIVMGDSNAVGYDVTEAQIDTTPYGTLYSYVYTLNDALSYANDPMFPNPAARKSAWPTLAGKWMAERNEEVSFIMSAVGGTCIAHGQVYFESTYGGAHVGPPTDCADMPVWPPDPMIPRLNTVPGNEGQDYCWAKYQYQEALDKHYLRPQQLKAILLMVGANDANDTNCVAHALMETKVEEFAAGVLRDFGKPVIVAPVGDQADWVAVAGRNATCLADVNSAMDDAIATPGNNVFAGPNLDDLDYSVDGVHIQSMSVVGGRWYTILNALFP